jgi:hypothetical protein
MQMAMVLTGQKPTQRARNGERSEGLPGSTKSVGCVERSVENLRDPGGSWEKTQVGDSKHRKEHRWRSGSQISP